MIEFPISAWEILDLAKAEPKGDYRKYSTYKRKLEYLSLNPEQYDIAHHELVRILEV